MSYSSLQKVLPEVIEAIGRMGLSDLLPFRQVQPRLNVPPNPRTGRFQRQLPGPREVPVENIPRRAQYPQAETRPAENAAERAQVLLEQAARSGLRITPRGGSLRTGFGTPEFSEYVFNRARTPQTVRMSAPSALSPSPAPEPAWGRVERLRASDPAMYERLYSIAKSTGAERGVNPDDIMQALVSPEGLESPILEKLRTPSPFDKPGMRESMQRNYERYEARNAPPGQPPVSSLLPGTSEVPGGSLARTQGLTDPSVEYVRVSEVSPTQRSLPEASPFSAFGGVQVVDLRQALATPEFLRGMGRNLEDFAQAVPSSPATAATTAQVSNRLRQIPMAPVIGGGILGGLGVTALLSQQQPEYVPSFPDGAPNVPGQTPLGIPTATPDTGANFPAVEGAPNLGTPLPPTGGTNAIPGTVNPSSAAPSASLGGVPAAPTLPQVNTDAAGRPVVSATGAGAVVQQMNDSDSNYRQAVQNAAQALREDATQYKNIGDFYKVQQAYANAPGRAQQIIESLKAAGAPKSVGIESTADFETWARQHPELAYRLQLQTQRRAVSQQMPQAQGTTVGTTMGTNFMNNAVGQSRAAAINAAYGTQGAADLANTLAPQAYPTMQKTPLF